MFGTGWSAASPSVAGPFSGATITGPTTTIGAGAYAMLPTDTNIRVTGGPATITLLGAANLRDGQRVYIVSFDASGNAVTIAAQAGDNIVGAGPWQLAQYGAFVELQVRISGGGTVANWLVVSSNTFVSLPFPIQPVLAAGAQGPISMGYILLPQGPRYLHSLFFALDAAIAAGGHATVNVHGLFADPTTIVIGPAAAGNGTIYGPGNPNRVSVPNLAGTNVGTRIQATVTTDAAFGGATTIAGLLQAW